MKKDNRAQQIFTHPVRIYYEDTDAGGIVYHASFLRFTERGRSEFLRAHGINNSDLLPGHGFHFVVRHIAIDYLAPGRLDDELVVETSVVDLGNASFTMQQTITRDGQAIADMKVVLVCVNAAGKAVRVPEMLRTILEAKG
ncbi:MAG: tol-pal system-associated acyl-CoA thioesterase [Rhodospirillales bacterium]|nr:tol-pal system-associated acyl-CoA thioesterase [Alphaproteobacteria bacterium]MCB9987394.1 tol-pal system-associated acyl-CoA thioesterase [Rhodospirillales bacterium]USO07624.1 MAG: tol-pal system-associated acyl-CoA thioesterase [Rhodospirillales bacterium]